MKTLRLIFHPIPIGIATYLSLVLATKGAIDWDSIRVLSFLNHAILLLLSLTASFSIFSYYRTKIHTPNPHLILYDNFEHDTDWKDYGAGRVRKSDEKSWGGRFSLKKESNPDPYGGYRLIGRKIRAPFIFSGWIYRSDIENGRWADRLAIEDENNNGYGFSISHGNRVTAIERRDKGKGRALKGEMTTPPLEKWYHFVMYFGLDGKIDLVLYDSSGVCLVNINDCTDNSYKEFDRIIVHGGYPYFIDDVKLMSI